MNDVQREPRGDTVGRVIAPFLEHEAVGTADRRPVVTETCCCGHARNAHEHYRTGADCGICGAGSCSAFRLTGGPVRRLLRWCRGSIVIRSGSRT